MRDHWTDKLPSLLEGHEEAAPEGLWDAVQAGLAPSKPRARVLWWPWAAGVLAAAAAVVLGVFLWRPSAVPSTDNRLSQVVPERSDVPETPADTPSTPSDTPVAPVRTPSVTHSRAQNDAVPFSAAPETDSVPSVEDSVEVAGEAAPEQEVAPAPEARPDTVQVPETYYLEDPVEWPEEPARRRKTARGRLEIALGSGGYLAQAGGGVSQGYGVPSNPGLAVADVPTRSGITVEMLSRNRESQTESRHRQLLRLSLDASYGFAPRWSIGTGLSYSWLQSDYTTVSGTTETTTTRELHYLGVPLTLRFNALETPRWELYLSTGPMLETAVGGQSETRAFISGQPASLQQEPLSVRDFRWSLQAGAGVQLRLFRYGALFAEPCLRWHIPGAEGPESAYTVRPLAFDLNLGFRFTF